MKKKNDMARECAKLLKEQGKAVEDVPEYALKFLLRHLKRKKSTGRPPHSGLLSGVTPSMDFSDLRKRFAGDPFKTRLLDLFEIAMRQRPAKPKYMADQQKPQTTDELRRQRRDEQAHITSKDEMQQHRQKRDATATAYERFLEHIPVPDDLSGDERKQEIKKRFAKFLLTPAGKFTDAMASHICNALKIRELPVVRFAKKSDGKEWKPSLIVEDRYQFASKGRVMEAIHDFARQLKFELRKQH